MKILKSMVLLGSVALMIAGTAYMAGAEGEEAAKGGEYIGSTKCKACHMKGDIYKVWSESAHAKATEVLPADAKSNGTCLACHATGYGKPGGYDPKAESNVGLEGVGCEDCHGAASEWKMIHMKDKEKAITMGLIMPKADNCLVCHAGKVPEGHKALPEFKFDTFWPKIAHALPKKEG